MATFGGPVLFLDRADINTDEIIPAKYLVETSKEALKPHLMEDLILPGFDPKGAELSRAAVIVTRNNFGCGSSREHAVWVLEVNNIRMVIAEGFSRIFRQNMFNCGLLAIQLPAADIDRIFSLKAATVEADVDKGLLVFKHSGGELSLSFSVSEFDAALVKNGGWVEYASTHY